MDETATLDRETWRMWIDRRRDTPYDYPMVWIKREEWTRAELVNPRELSPMMNAAGLYWKPLY